jgi:predicted ABC-type ATPase
MIYIVRGLPGSGKSTLAKTLSNSLQIPMFEADQYFYQDGTYNFDATKLHLAHKLCFANFAENIHTGCVVSNTFTKESELRPYIDACKQADVLYTVIIVENRHGNESVHNVPQTVVENMKNRFDVSL